MQKKELMRHDMLRVSPPRLPKPNIGGGLVLVCQPLSHAHGLFSQLFTNPPLRAPPSQTVTAMGVIYFHFRLNPPNRLTQFGELRFSKGPARARSRSQASRLVQRESRARRTKTLSSIARARERTDRRQWFARTEIESVRRDPCVGLL